MMRWLLLLGILAALIPGATNAAVPDPVTCDGYPEHRIFLENQSWWTPQAVDVTRPTHPGTGGVGHIHVGTCFPAYQSLAADTLELDINVKLHNMTGTSGNIRVYAYGDTELEFNGTQSFNRGKCDSADCETWLHVSFPLWKAKYRGWHEFAIFMNVIGADGVVQRNWSRYYAVIDRPSLPEAPAGSTVEHTTKPVRTGVNSVTGGDSWYGTVVGGATGKYAQAKIKRSAIPWDEASGALEPVSGVWSVDVGFEAPIGFVYVDPALHATPPSHGLVAYENGGSAFKTVTVDTTKLSNGLHRLLIGTSNVATNGVNSGVLVVPFLVENDC